MKKIPLLLFSITVALVSFNCNKKGDLILADDCSGDLFHWPPGAGPYGRHEVVLPDSSWGLMTDKAAGSCTSYYHLYFRWADAAKQSDTVAPPIQATFSPAGSPGSEIPEADGSLSPFPGKGWWHIGFAPTPTSTSGNTTQFTISVKNTTTDSVEMMGQIQYRVSPN